MTKPTIHMDSRTIICACGDHFTPKRKGQTECATCEMTNEMSTQKDATTKDAKNAVGNMGRRAGQGSSRQIVGMDKVAMVAPEDATTGSREQWDATNLARSLVTSIHPRTGQWIRASSVEYLATALQAAYSIGESDDAPEAVLQNMTDKLAAASERERGLREDVRTFAELMSAAMDSKAIERDTREQPHYMSVDYKTEEALPRMREKLDELLYALGLSTADDFRTFYSVAQANSERVVKTAVHLANFCMIVAAKVRAALAGKVEPW